MSNVQPPATAAKPREYTFHPLADIFPLLEDNSIGFNALVEDIKERGQQEPIWLYEGKILDGRNRYRACQKIGREVKTQEYLGSDPVGFVLSANIHRRHLNESQRAMVGAKLANLDVGANQITKGSGTSIDVAAKLLSVGRASIDRAKKVLAKGDPSLVEAVEQGKVTVSAAADIVDQPKEQQQETVKAAKKGKTAKGGTGKTGTRNKSDSYDTVENKLVDKLLAMPADNADASAANTIRRLKQTVATMKKAAEAAAKAEEEEEQIEEKVA